MGGVIFVIVVIGAAIYARAVDTRKRKRPSGAFIGATMGPLLGILYSQARIGSPGQLWSVGKGGETFMTPSGRTIFVIVVVGGAIVGALCGRAIDARSRESGAKGAEIG